MGRKMGILHAFWGGGAGSPSNTVSLESRLTFLLSGILIHGATWPQPIWAENREAVPLKEGDLGPRGIQYGRAEAYLRAKFHLDQSDRLATTYQRHRQDRRDRQTDNGPIG